MSPELSIAIFITLGTGLVIIIRSIFYIKKINKYVKETHSLTQNERRLYICFMTAEEKLTFELTIENTRKNYNKEYYEAQSMLFFGILFSFICIIMMLINKVDEICNRAISGFYWKELTIIVVFLTILFCLRIYK